MNNESEILEIITVFSNKLSKFPDGRINYSNSNKAPVLNILVKHEDKILLLKRSDKVRAYQGLWNCVGGYLDEIRPIKEKVLEELTEELKITEPMIKDIKFGEHYEFDDKTIQKTWIIQPVLVELKAKPKITLDWEHTDFKWIEKDDLKEFNHVPGLDLTFNLNF